MIYKNIEINILMNLINCKIEIRKINKKQFNNISSNTNHNSMNKLSLFIDKKVMLIIKIFKRKVIRIKFWNYLIDIIILIRIIMRMNIIVYLIKQNSFKESLMMKFLVYKVKVEIIKFTIYHQN